MKKTILLVSTIYLFSLAGFSQISDGMVSIQKQNVQAITVEMQQPAKVVKEAIQKNMNKRGYKDKESGDFIIFKEVKLNDTSAERFDLYLKVDKKSKKEKDASMVYFAAARGYTNFLDGTRDPEVYNGWKTFAAQFPKWVETHALDISITDQEDIVKSANKKLDKLIDEQQDLEKKKKKIETDIEANIKDREKQKAELETQQRILDNLKTKRA